MSERTVVLGGEYRRSSLTDRGRIRPEFVGMGLVAAIVIALGLAVLKVAYLAALLTWAVGAMVGIWLFIPRRSLSGSSKSGLIARGARWRSRVRKGLHSFTPGEPARKKGLEKGKVTTKPRLVPDWVGDARRVAVRIHPDSDESVLVLLHKGDAGGLGYAVVVLDVEAGAGTSDEEYASFGRFKAVLAQEDSLIGGIQQLERVTRASVHRHRRWWEQNRVSTCPDVLRESYEQVLNSLEELGENHRSLLVLRMPFTNDFIQQVHSTYGEVTYATRAQTAVLEAQRAASSGMTHARYRSMRPLSERQVAGYIASTFDPTLEDDDESFTLDTCWPAYDADDRKVEVVGASGKTWLMRIARIERLHLPGNPIPVNAFRGLVVGVYPAVTRTVSVIEELTPAWVAKQEALEAQTVDRARLKQTAGRVTDGSEADQATASQQRLSDLRMGQGHQGDGFAVHVTIQAPTQEELTKATQRIEAAANEFTRLTWLTKEQDLALVHAMPLGKGLDMRPRKGVLR